MEEEFFGVHFCAEIDEVAERIDVIEVGAEHEVLTDSSGTTEEFLESVLGIGLEGVNFGENWSYILADIDFLPFGFFPIFVDLPTDAVSFNSTSLSFEATIALNPDGSPPNFVVADSNGDGQFFPRGYLRAQGKLYGTGKPDDSQHDSRATLYRDGTYEFPTIEFVNDKEMERTEATVRGTASLSIDPLDQVLLPAYTFWIRTGGSAGSTTEPSPAKCSN